MQKIYYELLDKAVDMRRRAYAGYSEFMVGAALLCTDGKIYTGCNIENASYSLTLCAERNAIFRAVCDEERNFEAIAVAGALNDCDCTSEPCVPCGACLQVMSEFCSPDFKIILFNKGEPVEFTLSDFLPKTFSLYSR
ncbi:MAG: cytidine deaminase [Oscillospiraceae bacterium]|nr:cytidine deaminase [Oscillospiraceae bacterium]